MTNPWLKINLSDYENHMAMPAIAQTQYLAGLFENLLEKFSPESVAVIGCAGGNGLEKINSEKVKRIVCVEINPDFLSAAEDRYGKKFDDCEFRRADISSPGIDFAPVDFIFSPLVFEYTDPDKALANISRLTVPGGNFATVLQLPNENIPEVSPSPYTTLNTLSEIFSFVRPEEMKRVATANGFDPLKEKITTLNSGKSFCELSFRKK